MKVLVIGGGGREHAVCKKLSESKDVTEILCAPGNAGIARVARCIPDVKATDIDGIVALASDAFFPFDDCVKACAEAGISCIIQPGGSVRDQDSIDACDRYGIAMVFTGMRHFKH